MLLLDARVCETDKQRVKVEEGVARAPRRFRKDIGLVSIGVEISKRRHAICDRAKKKERRRRKGTNGSTRVIPLSVHRVVTPFSDLGRHPEDA